MEDKKWVQEQIDRYMFDFDQADKDKNGSLCLQEIVAVLKAEGFKGTDEQLKAIFAHLDQNDDDKVSREEFKARCDALPVETVRESKLRKMFQQMDRDGTGVLSRSEVMNAFRGSPDINVPANVVTDILMYLIGDADRQVDYEEFLHVLKFEESASYLRQVFSRLDTDGRGYLSYEEIQAAINQEGPLQELRPQLKDLLKVSADSPGANLNYKEFIAAWLSKKGEGIGK